MFALIGQLSGILLLPFLSEINDTVRWGLPWILILSSCRWWPNYVTQKSRIGKLNIETS